MSDSNDIRELITQLRELTARLEVRKGKDAWERLSVLTPFVATVVLAGISLFFTKSFERAEADRQQAFREAQLSMQEAQVRVEELKAMVSAAPLLASDNERTREVGKQLLQAVSATGSYSAEQSASPSQENEESSPTPPVQSPGQAPQSGGAPGVTARSRTSLLDAYARIALASDVPAPQRVEAMRGIGMIATAPNASRDVRERATTIAVQVAAAPGAPEEVRQSAEAVIEKIRTVGPGGEEVVYTVDDNGSATFVSGWDEEKLVKVYIPQLRGIPGAPPSRTIRFYGGAAEDLKRAWAEIERAGLLPLVKSWDGAYVPRTIRNTSRLSPHALGIAFDINSRWNRLGVQSPPEGEEGSVRALVPIFQRHGFEWGGSFPTPDPQHFYWTRGSRPNSGR